MTLTNSTIPSQPFQLQLTLRPPPRPLCVSMDEPLSLPVVLPHTVTVHLMRHGESASNARKLITGSTNVPLTLNGKRQARKVGRKLAPRYDAAFSSTLRRSIETMQLAIKAGKVEVESIIRNPYLDERSLGELELQPVRPIPGYAAGDFHYAPCGGENYSTVTRRSLYFLADVAQWIRKEWTQRQRKIERILVCSHMGPMRIITAILNEDTDPAVVLARSFSTADRVEFSWRRLTCPMFHLDDI